MQKKIFIINGSGGVGKDTFVSMVSSFIKTENYSSVDCIKKAAQLIGYDGQSKKEKDRKFLSDLKILSSSYYDHPYKMIVNKINQFMSEDNEDKFLFIHVREPEEIKRLKNDFPNINTLLVINNNVKPIYTNMADRNVEHFRYDYTINNSYSLLDLHKNAKQFAWYFGFREEDPSCNNEEEYFIKHNND